RLDERQALRYRQRLHLRRGHVLGVAAAVHQRADLVAQLVCFCRRTEANDLAGDFEPGKIRGIGRHRVIAAALQNVGPVDAGLGGARTGAALQGRDLKISAAQRRSTFPPERITPTRRRSSETFRSKRAQAASAPVGSTTIFIRSQRKNIARKSSSSLTVSMS